MKTIYGKDSAGNKSYIQVSRDENKICVYSPEDASDVIFTVKQAKELIDAIKKCINEQ